MTRRHLRYPSLEAWRVGEGLPVSFFSIADPDERDRRITQYAELRRRLFKQHLRSLTKEERRQFDQGEHPSQSHRFVDRARPFADELRDHLARLGIPAQTEIGLYHLDRIVLDAMLPADPGASREQLPWLFHGFEVLYHWPGVAKTP